MKLAKVVTYCLGALVSRGLPTEASNRLRQHVEPAVPVSQSNTVRTSNPKAAGIGLLRLVDATTCQSVLYEVEQYDDPSIDKSFISCDTPDGKSYKITGLSKSEVNSHGNRVARDEEEVDFPEGSYIDEATATVKTPHGKKVGFKNKNNANGKGAVGTINFEEDGDNRNLQQNGGAGITGTRSVLVVRVVAADATTTASEAQLSDSVFGTFGDAFNLKSQYNACSYGQLNFVPAANRTGSGGDIANGTCTVNHIISPHHSIHIYFMCEPSSHSNPSHYFAQVRPR